VQYIPFGLARIRLQSINEYRNIRERITSAGVLRLRIDDVHPAPVISFGRRRQASTLSAGIVKAKMFARSYVQGALDGINECLHAKRLDVIRVSGSIGTFYCTKIVGAPSGPSRRVTVV
jgi:hypothetical protein